MVWSFKEKYKSSQGYIEFTQLLFQKVFYCHSLTPANSHLITYLPSFSHKPALVLQLIELNLKHKQIMLFMKKQRADVMSEYTLHDSVAINQILGRKWNGWSRPSTTGRRDRPEKSTCTSASNIRQLMPIWSARLRSQTKG